jgi:hypothetical protein
VEAVQEGTVTYDPAAELAIVINLARVFAEADSPLSKMA